MPWEMLTETKRGANKERWRRVVTDRALSLLWAKVIVETEAELILKATTLREVQRALNEAGRDVFAITPTASAARVLRKEGFGQAITVEDFLRNAESRGGLQNAIVICDEAGLKSNRQGEELLRLAQKHNIRVLLVGDVRQHVSVEAGDFLRVLEAHSKLGRCR